MFYDWMSDEEFVRRLRANHMTSAEEALIFRLERALDKKPDAYAVGQHGAQPSTPVPKAPRGEVKSSKLLKPQGFRNLPAPVPGDSDTEAASLRRVRRAALRQQVAQGRGAVRERGQAAGA